MNVRKCLTCQTMQPEDKMIRRGPDWICKNKKNCQKGVQIRSGDEVTTHVRDYVHRSERTWP